MSKQKAVFFLGIWTALLPFLGFPSSWKRVLGLISGIAIAYAGYLLNKEKTGVKERHHPNALHVDSEASKEESVQ